MRWILPLLALAPIAAAAVWLHGCGLSCTAVGYPEGLHVRLQRPAWEPAEYRVEGETEDGPFTCTFGLDRVASCQPETVSVGGWGWTAGEVVVFSDHPKTVALAVYRDDEFLGAGTFVPHYVHREPNGEGCGEQIYAEETLELPGPTPCGVDETCRCVYDDGCGCETDDVPASPWSVCHGRTVPASVCVSACACGGVAPDCQAACGGYPRQRALCVDGAWACADPAYPVPVATCGGAR